MANIQIPYTTKAYTGWLHWRCTKKLPTYTIFLYCDNWHTVRRL